MKNLILVSTLLVLSLMVKAQTPFTVSEGESAIVYSLPKTVFCIELETEKVTQKPGMFYRYSDRYLATNKVITEAKTTYKIKSIQVKVSAVPDPARTYSLVPGASQLSKLAVNSQGILCGVNVTCKQDKVESQAGNLIVNDNTTPDVLLPLGEEYMMAGSEAKLAEGAAKQIYHIRESRLSLLCADVDKLPADGESFKTMLDGLNKQEAKLTELFIGQKITETQTQTLYLTPTVAVNNDVLFRLSALKGIVASDDLSGAPYYISIVPAKIPGAADKSKQEKGDLYYILPASTQLTISDGINTLYSNQFFVSQFGKTLALPESMFKQSKVKVNIDPLNGRLLNVE